jgi:hypothetical protein
MSEDHKNEIVVPQAQGTTPSEGASKNVEMVQTPHWLTVTVAALAMFATAFSAYYSYRAFDLNNQTNHATQRAYMTVRKFQPVVVTEDGQTILIFKTDLYNGGNTPATNSCAITTVYIGVQPHSTAPQTSDDNPDFVGPKDTYTLEPRINLPQDYLVGKDHLPKYPIYVRGSLTYRTVYKTTEGFSWCESYRPSGELVGCQTKEFRPVPVPKNATLCK